MELNTLLEFFVWCTIINIAVFIYSCVMVIFAKDYIYRMQAKWFDISKETFHSMVYGYLGLYKILIIVFNIVPLLALLIIS